MAGHLLANLVQLDLVLASVLPLVAPIDHTCLGKRACANGLADYFYSQHQHHCQLDANEPNLPTMTTVVSTASCRINPGNKVFEQLCLYNLLGKHCIIELFFTQCK